MMNNFNTNQFSLLEKIIALICNRTNRQPKINGRNIILHCPAHEDKKPSLSVSEGKDGKVLIKCFSGCALQDICKSVGIEVKDLFPKKSRG